MLYNILMKQIAALIITLSFAGVASTASALSYDMQGGLSNPQDCNIGDSYWRTDELTQDSWGTYTDPYAYGALPHSDLSYPLRPYAGADDVYYGTTSYDNTYGGASSQVTYDTYDSGYYAQGGSYDGDYSVDAVANANLQRAMGGRTTTTSGVSGSGTGGSAGGVRVVQNTDTATRSTGPKCTLIPRSTNSNSVVLEWQTVGASSAFIDNGVGHVTLGTGTRMVTPRVTTTYNMTVVDGRGFSSQCAAIVHVLGGTETGAANTTIIPAAGTTGTSTTTGTGTATSGTTVTTDPVTAVTDTASTVGTNVSEKVTSVLSSGQGIWDKMRQMSLVAIGLFFIVFIIIFVMKKMFGGGDEGHH
jgi:hypothetical protein